jgi:putative hydrolase
MSNFPFGFNPGPEDGGEGERPSGDQPSGGTPAGGVPTDPFAAMLGGGGGDIGAGLQRLGQLMSWQGGPVNWDLARDVARQAVAASEDRSVTSADREPVLDAMRLAELWLDEATAFPSGATAVAAWSRAEWVEATLPAWRELVDPVAGKVVDSLGSMLTGEGGPLAGGLPGMAGLPAEQMAAMSQMAGPLQQMMRSIGGAMFGTQLGQAIGSLAVEVVGSTDVGLPLAGAGRAALLPANVAVFGEGLEVPADQVRLYLALREAAHHRLFAHAPWLRAHLVDAVAAYARGITVDAGRLEEAMGSVDPTDPESLQRALTGGMFEPEDTPEQKAALLRLETALALVEGWVDEVVDAAASPHLPALRETVRRRRASGGPGEQTFASLVGLELRPRRLRDAAALWRAVLAEKGQDGREALWSHPDLLPTADDLDDPDAFARGGSAPLDLSGLQDTEAPPEPPRPGDEGPSSSPPSSPPSAS